MDIKDRIIQEASQLFMKFGIRNITMDRIAENLGVSKRTIYENFKDKDELLNFCLESGMKKQKKRYKETIKNSVNIIEAILTFIRNSVNALNIINPVFFSDLQKYYPSQWDKYIEVNNSQNLDKTIQLLRMGVEGGFFRKCINLEIVGKLILEQFNLLNNQDIFPEDRYSKVEVFENIAINFTRGIATSKGLSFLEKYQE